jgi:ribosomal protein S12 methylthiotransferase accessory factor YcaO
MANKTLQNHWQRHDWQTSPFAPHLRIVQALVRGKTASGAGFSRHDALLRCLGETAEIIALNEGEPSAGMAAGPDMPFASEHALREGLERWALADWWHGRLKAQPTAAPGLISDLRQDATPPRETRTWLLADFPHLYVAIARSRSPAGTQPVLGFGAHTCPIKATRSALIELGLMELNLQDRPAGLRSYFARLAAKADSHFPSAPPSVLHPAPHPAPLADCLTKAGVGFTLENRTPVGSDLVVVKAILPQATGWRGRDTPLL